MSLGAPLAEPLSHQHWLLPLRPNLLAQLLGVLQAPATKLVRVLNEPASALARVLKAQSEKGGAPAE